MSCGLHRAATRLRWQAGREPRPRAVIARVWTRKRWKPSEKAGGRGRGVGFAKYKNLAAYLAVIRHRGVARALETEFEN